MPLARKFRLYAVTIHNKTTRETIIPEYEIGVVKAAWRGNQITAVVTNDIREIVMDSAAAYKSLMNRYKVEAVKSMFPGPERLEQDMETAADKTDAWLATVAQREERIEAERKAKARAEREATAAAEKAAQEAAAKEAARLKANQEAAERADKLNADAEAERKAKAQTNHGGKSA